MKNFKILSIGWEPRLIEALLEPVSRSTGIAFIHGLTGDKKRCEAVRKRFPELNVTPLADSLDLSNLYPDRKLLRDLEGSGIPTIWSMLQSDVILRYRKEDEALTYATVLANGLVDLLRKHQPDLVLASFDGLHSALSLAVAKKLDTPWVSMSFPVIPDNLTGFSNSMSPEALLPFTRPVNEEMKQQARRLIESVRSRQQKVMAYRAPATLADWVNQYSRHVRNFLRARRNAKLIGASKFTHYTFDERCRDIVRRSWNRLRMPIKGMLDQPPTGPFAYFPLHMSHESVLDTWAPFFQDQLALCSQIVKALPLDVPLVVKPHFSDPDQYSRAQFQRLMRMPGLRMAHPNAPGAAFIEKAALVVGIQGTSSLEAALLAKPVLLFGKSPYMHFPAAERAERPDLWNEQIKGLLERGAPSDEEIVDAYARYMTRYMPGRINDWSKSISDEDLRLYAECFCRLRNHLIQPENRGNWYEFEPFGPKRMDEAMHDQPNSGEQNTQTAATR